MKKLLIVLLSFSCGSALAFDNNGSCLDDAIKGSECAAPEKTPVAEPTGPNVQVKTGSFYSNTGWNAGGLIRGDGKKIWAVQASDGHVTVWCKAGETCWEINGNNLDVFSVLGEADDPTQTGSATQYEIYKN